MSKDHDASDPAPHAAVLLREHARTLLYALDAVRQQRLDLIMDPVQAEVLDSLWRAYRDLKWLVLEAKIVPVEQVTELHELVVQNRGEPLLLYGVPPPPN